MQLLVVYSSRSGMTRKVAQVIASRLFCQIEEIVDLKNTGNNEFQRELTEIDEIRNDVALFEVVLIGTPTLHNTISSAIRTYLHNNKERFKKVAFFCSGGIEDIVFREMECLCGKAPIATLCLRKEDMKQRRYIAKTEEFAAEVPASILSDMSERIDKARPKASLEVLHELRAELDCVSTYVKRIHAPILSKRLLEDDLQIAYDLLDSSIFRLEQLKRGKL